MAGDLWEERDLGSFISCQRAGTVHPRKTQSAHCNVVTRPICHISSLQGCKWTGSGPPKFRVHETKTPACSFIALCLSTSSNFLKTIIFLTTTSVSIHRKLPSTPAEWAATGWWECARAQHHLHPVDISQAARINGAAGYCCRHQTKHTEHPAQVISRLSLFNVTV